MTMRTEQVTLEITYDPDIDPTPLKDKRWNEILGVKARVVEEHVIGYVSGRDLSRLETYKGTIWPSINEVAIKPVYIKD